MCHNFYQTTSQQELFNDNKSAFPEASFGPSTNHSPNGKTSRKLKIEDLLSHHLCLQQFRTELRLKTVKWLFCITSTSIRRTFFIVIRRVSPWVELLQATVTIKKLNAIHRAADWTGGWNDNLLFFLQVYFTKSYILAEISNSWNNCKKKKKKLYWSLHLLKLASIKRSISDKFLEN